MLAVLQRVTHASVKVNEQTIGQIQQGLLILCGFAPDDNEDTLDRMVQKCLNYRVFSDEAGKMNRSLLDINGGLLLVPQFTLMADTKSGLRPSFSNAAPPAQAQALFEHLVQKAKLWHSDVQTGSFGADMQVSLCNDGPVTFVMAF